MIFNCLNKSIDLMQPKVMGILNITPDSFYSESRVNSVDDCLRRAVTMVEEGAAIIDIGGESTRPGSQPVSIETELERVVPVLTRLRQEIDVPIAVDTNKPEVMRAAIAAGADIINDINALQAPGALEIVAAAKVGVCLMHMQGKPTTMQLNPHYTDIMTDIKDFLIARITACEQAGISRSRIIIDPGFGFGKTVQHNLILLNRLAELKALQLPILIGLSRKSTIGKILNDRPAEDRLHASIAGTTIAVLNGANIVRTHDVRPTVDAITFLNVLQEKTISQ
jgi:dihydropteroate synthase